MTQADLFAPPEPAETRRAVFDPSRLYRYLLEIIWDSSLPVLVAIMLNPSTADEIANDPTVERVCRRARQRGFGGVIVLNAFAWRATKPEDMKRAVDPVGPDNDATISAVLERAHEGGWTVFAGWGQHGVFRERHLAVLALCNAAGVQLMCLKISNGQPWHPLYVSYAQDFIPYRP